MVVPIDPPPAVIPRGADKHTAPDRPPPRRDSRTLAARRNRRSPTRRVAERRNVAPAAHSPRKSPGTRKGQRAVKWHGDARATGQLDNQSFSGATDRQGSPRPRPDLARPCPASPVLAQTWPVCPQIVSSPLVSQDRPTPSAPRATRTVRAAIGIGWPQLPPARHDCHPRAAIATLELQRLTRVSEAEWHSTRSWAESGNEPSFRLGESKWPPLCNDSGHGGRSRKKRR